MHAPTGGIQPLEPGDPAQVGTYRLLGRLGSGGMGQVFLGVSRGGRRVAVKVMRADLVSDPEFRTRFAREVAAARTVNGFYTAPVVDADAGATPPWMVTAYVQGPSLAAAVAERGPLGEDEVRELAAALAEGLASIHEGGLVHRDLKPANIILAGDGPRIIDFGIARAVGMSTMTEQGTIIGTFAYMSPEQVRGAAAGPPSDVFSLGSVLAFAATGRGPFEADSLAAITYRILNEEPDLAGVPGPLRDLMAGCLVKDRAGRLSLDELLTRLAAADSVAGVLALPVAFAAPQTGVAVPVSALVPVPALVSDDTSSAGLDGGGASGPRDLGAAAPAGYPGRPSLPSVRLDTFGWDVASAAFSPDGGLLAAGALLNGSWRVFLWDTETWQLTGEPVEGRGGAAPRVEFSPDGRFVMVKETDATRLLSPAAGEFVSLRAGAAGQSWKKVRFSPDGRLLVTANAVKRRSGFTGAALRLWDTATLEPAAGPFKVDFVAADTTLAFSPDSRYLFSGHEGQGFLGDITVPAPELRKLKDLSATSGRAAFSADGRLLAARHTGGNVVTVLDTASRAPVAELTGDRGIARIDFSPAPPVLATAPVPASVPVLATARLSGGETVELWRLAAPGPGQWPPPPAGQLTASRAGLDGFPLPASDLRFSPDGAFLAAVSRTRTQDRHALVRIWATDSAQPGSPLYLPGPLRTTFSPDGRFLALSCPDQAVRLVDLRTASQVPVLPGSNAVFSPSSSLLAVTEQGGLRLWSLPR